MRLLLALILSAALAPIASANPARSLTEAGIPGAVVLDRTGVHAAGDVRRDTRFRVGSVTKTFVATVTLQLVAEGRLALDEPVPEAGGAPLRTLLNHTSGMYNHSDDPRVFEQGLLKQWEPSELVAIARSHPPVGPGFHYSNTNYVILGLVIERVTGRSVERELQRRIIRPLRLADTAYEEGPWVRGLAPGRPQNTSWAGAAGALVSTARDLARFYRALPRLLGPALLAAMRDGDPYGLGLFRVDASCGAAWGHNGRVPDSLAHAYVRGERVVVLLADQQPLPERAETAVNRVLDAALCS